MSLLDYAKSELDRIYTPEALAEDNGDGPNKWIYDNILEIIKIFGEQGHSGFSASYLISSLEKLMRWEPLTPLTFEDDEWECVGDRGDFPQYQNKRLSSVFKDGKDGQSYYLYAIIMREENGSTWSGSFTLKDGSTIGRSHYIKKGINFPHKNKTFYIDVISHRFDKKEDGSLVPNENGDWWEHEIKDESQLEEVWKYYDRK